MKHKETDRKPSKRIEKRLIAAMVKADLNFRAAKNKLDNVKDEIKKYAKETGIYSFENEQAQIFIYLSGVGDYLSPELVQKILTPGQYRACCLPKKPGWSVKVTLKK